MFVVYCSTKSCVKLLSNNEIKINIHSIVGCCVKYFHLNKYFINISLLCKKLHI